MEVTKTNSSTKKNLDAELEFADESDGKVPCELAGFPTSTVGQLEEILEERVVTDRRQKNTLKQGAVDRRVGRRRRSDK